MDLLVDDIEKKITYRLPGGGRLTLDYPYNHHLDVSDSIQIKWEIEKLERNIKLIEKWANTFPVRIHTQEEAKAYSKFIDEYFHENGG